MTPMGGTAVSTPFFVPFWGRLRLRFGVLGSLWGGGLLWGWICCGAGAAVGLGCCGVGCRWGRCGAVRELCGGGMGPVYGVGVTYGALCGVGIWDGWDLGLGLGLGSGLGLGLELGLGSGAGFRTGIGIGVGIGVGI